MVIEGVIPVADEMQSALRQGRVRDGRNDLEPAIVKQLDTRLIQTQFGDGASLFSILEIKTGASDEEIKNAYLKKGRQILFEHGLVSEDRRGKRRYDDTPRQLRDCPRDARLQFQAITVAFEVLTNPALRREYDVFGIPKTDYCNALKTNRRKGRQKGVRWSPFVEEKLFEPSPDEHVQSVTHMHIETEQRWMAEHRRKLQRSLETFRKNVRQTDTKEAEIWSADKDDNNNSISQVDEVLSVESCSRTSQSSADSSMGSNLLEPKSSGIVSPAAFARSDLEGLKSMHDCNSPGSVLDFQDNVKDVLMHSSMKACDCGVLLPFLGEEDTIDAVY